MIMENILNADSDFFEQENESENETNVVTEYDITVSPRDLTPANIVEMIDNKIMEIPFFQRNYVWDIKKASKLIESLILGLPVPELFFYSEGDENSSYKIIDGQQRLLSIYFFLKGRFPKNVNARIMLGDTINKGQDIDAFFADNKLFQDFVLQLNSEKDGIKSRYHGMKYVMLDKDTQIKFKLRRFLRTVVVRQNKPDDNKSSMFEIFNRLNTGGAALNNQEIRASLYYCGFYEILSELNKEPKWRNLLGNTSKDLHSNDVELILRVFALLIEGKSYAPKMASFLNSFSQHSKKMTEKQINYCKNLFISFLNACDSLPSKAFFRNNRFSKPFFESVFLAVCENCYSAQEVVKGIIDKDSFESLKNNSNFIMYMQAGSSSRDSIDERKKIALQIIKVNGD